MKNAILAVCFASCLFAGCLVGLAGAATAQTTYDISDYFMTGASQYSITEYRPLGNPQAPVEKRAVVVQRQGTFVMQNAFSYDGKNWMQEDIQVFELTKTHMVYYGGYDPVSLSYELFTPALKIPRNLKLGEAFSYSGILATEKGSAPITAMFVITADNITKQVKAGTFTKCIRFKGTITSDTAIEIWSEIRAKGLGAVYGIETEIDETEPEAQMLWAERFERTDPKKP